MARYIFLGMNTEEWKPDFRHMAERIVIPIMEGNTPEKVEEAICNYEEYLKICWGIVDRLEREGKSLPTAEEMAILEQQMDDIPEDGRKRKKK